MSKLFSNSILLAAILCSLFFHLELKAQDQISGCTDPVACNYNYLAEIDDGSCVERSLISYCHGDNEEGEIFRFGAEVPGEYFDIVFISADLEGIGDDWMNVTSGDGSGTTFQSGPLGNSGTQITGLDYISVEMYSDGMFSCQSGDSDPFIIAYCGTLEFAALNVFVETSNTICEGGERGVAQAVIFGGAEPIEIDWQGEDPRNLEAGNYQIIATDANNTSKTISYTVKDGFASCGCTYPQADNFDPEAEVDDDSCIFTYVGPGFCPGDFDADASITSGDLLFFLAYFGTQCQ